MQDIQRRGTQLILRAQQPTTYRPVRVPIPARPWNTPEKIGVVLIGVGAVGILVGAIIRASGE